jgi:hypothetical protein
MSVVLLGSTSGSVTLQEPAIAGSTVIDLPATSGTMAVLPTATSVLPEASGGTGTTTGYYGFKNRIINGAMVLFQRGTAATTDFAYSVDRWRFAKGNDATESVSQSTDAPVGFSYSLRNTISTGDATIGATQFSGFQQLIEGYNIADLNWGTANAQPITISFWIRSSVTGTYTGNVRNSDDTRINPFNFTISSANTWEKKTITITGDTSGTWQSTTSAGIIFAVYAALGSSYTGGTAGTWGTTPAFGCGSPVNGIASNGNIFAISGVQLEKGSTATSFDYRPYTTELQLCQRYYWKNKAGGVYTYLASAVMQTSSSGTMFGKLPVSMRANPSVAINTVAIFGGVSIVAVTGLSSNYSSVDQMAIDITGTSFTPTTGAVALIANNSTSAFIELSAEL